MKMEFAEYLKSQGASPEDIKALTEGSFSGVARKAFEKLQSDAAEATRKGVEAEANAAKYKEDAEKWFNEKAVPEYNRMERESTLAKANEARIVAAVLASQDEGLKEIAKQMGYPTNGSPNPNPNPNPNPALPAGFDPAKFVTMDTLNPLMDRVGENLATLEDMVSEHVQLFPSVRLSVRELRKEALAAKKNVYEYWEQKYKVPDARTAAEAARQKAHDDLLIKQGADAERERMTSLYGNPETRPLATSTSPFATRKETGRDKQPWEAGESNLERDRVSRATKHVVEIASKTA
jgi:hypothetical protein